MGKKMNHLFKEVADMFIFFEVNFLSALVAEFPGKLIFAIFTRDDFLHEKFRLAVQAQYLLYIFTFIT